MLLTENHKNSPYFVFLSNNRIRKAKNVLFFKVILALIKTFKNRHISYESYFDESV